jgi:hypothetical protein
VRTSLDPQLLRQSRLTIRENRPLRGDELSARQFAYQFMNAKHIGRFVAYYRVSTARQGRSGLGLEAYVPLSAII